MQLCTVDNGNDISFCNKFEIFGDDSTFSSITTPQAESFKVDVPELIMIVHFSMTNLPSEVARL